MTLEEIKKRILALIEEINPESEYLTDDDDIQAKINYCIDMIQNELARIKKIPKIATFEVETGTTYDVKEEVDYLYKIRNIEIKDDEGNSIGFDLFGTTLIPEGDGVATVKYYKYPEPITADTPDTYEFEISQDILEILPYGAAADILKNDVAAQFGRVYETAYQSALQKLDINTNEMTYYIGDGVDV